MRRRHRGDRRLSAEELVGVYEQARAACAGASVEVTNHHVRQALEEYGYTPVDVFRARLWLRHGRPKGSRWDEEPTVR